MRVFLLLIATLGWNAAAAQSYRWTSLDLGGGGAVPGIVLHPLVKDLAYIRSDVGGAYRWDAAADRWLPLLDWIPPSSWNHYGVGSIAVDPADASGDIVWAAVGKYAEAWASPPQGALLRSRDRGRTWDHMLSVGVASNRDQPDGERIAIDPFSRTTIIYASRADGLQISTDDGVTWAPAAGIPRCASGSWPHLCFAAYGPTRGIVAVGSRDDGVFLSQDGGTTWSVLAHAPKTPRRAVFASDGALLVAGEDGLHRWSDGRWTSITPPGEKAMAAVSAHPRQTGAIIACTSGAHGQRIWRSRDGGASWTEATGSRRQTRNWWPDWHWFSATMSIAFDPHRDGRCWVTDWYGVYRTDAVFADSPQWTNTVTGIENLVTIGALTCPVDGEVTLFSGVADVGGFDHRRLDHPPPGTIWANGLPAGFSSTGVDACETNPALVARVGLKDWDGPGMGGWSGNGGTLWQPFARVPGGGGRIAITSDGAAFLWATQGAGVHRSTDRGRTWIPCEPRGALRNTFGGEGIFVWTQPLAVDLVDPATAYAVASDALWTSRDGGITFERAARLPDGDQVHLHAAPGIAGTTWIARGGGGLFRSEDRGATLQRDPAVAVARLLCFGVGPKRSGPPSAYVLGRLHDHGEGLFRTDDLGATWVRIDHPDQRLGNEPNTMAADRRVFGRVYVGTNGRGILIGQPD